MTKRTFSILSRTMLDTTKHSSTKKEYDVSGLQTHYNLPVELVVSGFAVSKQI